MADLQIQRLDPCAGRTLIIGDVHGCSDELHTLIEAFSPRPEDRLIAAGDLINRGPDSRRTLALAREARILPVLGNHEARLLNAWRKQDKSLLKSKDRKTFAQLVKDDWDWIAQWPHVLEIPSLRALVVHGGFAPGIPWKANDPGTVLSIQVLDRKGCPAKRSRSPNGQPWALKWTGPEHVYYGHTPRPHPLIHPFATGLDTGCVYGYSLTALSLPDSEIYRVHARRTYVDD